MKIITLNEEEFDKFAKKHKYENYLQTSNYANFEQNNGYQIHYLGFKDEEENLIGAALCLYKDLFWGYKYAYIPRGLLIDYDDKQLINIITYKLKKLLYKQKFIFIKIDPPIVMNKYDFDGKNIYTSPTAKNIIHNLISNNYKHFGFNLYYETKLPRWNAIIKLNKNIQDTFNNFDLEIKENIKDAKRTGIEVIEDIEGNIENFFEIIKDSYGKVGIKYFKNFFDSFNKNNQIDIFYALINSNNFVDNANKYYQNEEERNIGLSNIISSNDTNKYNVQKVINDKIESDKNLNKYKNEVITATNFLRKYPNGKIIAAALVVKHQKGADCIVLYEDKNSSNFKGNDLLIYAMCEKYGNNNLTYLNLGPVIGNFNKKNPLYKKMLNKKGFNSTIIEYIGEFNLIINPLMYKVYEHKMQKKRKK